VPRHAPKGQATAPEQRDWPGAYRRPTKNNKKTGHLIRPYKKQEVGKSTKPCFIVFASFCITKNRPTKNIKKQQKTG
jgi:hypothetical protein